MNALFEAFTATLCNEVFSRHHPCKGAVTNRHIRDQDLIMQVETVLRTLNTNSIFTRPIALKDFTLLTSLPQLPMYERKVKPLLQ